MRGMVKTLFWSFKNSGGILNKLKSKVSLLYLVCLHMIYDFSTLLTTLPYNLIKEKLNELIEDTSNREGLLYLACNQKQTEAMRVYFGFHFYIVLLQ